MKRVIAGLTLCGALSLVSAQEVVPREEALKVVLITHLDLKLSASLPIRIDADLKYPYAVRAGEHGAMVVPETKLSAQTLAKAGSEPVPVGELWLRKANLLRDGQPVAADRLNLVNFPRETSGAPLFALAVRQAKEGQLELLFYGKAKEPVLAVPLKKVEATQQYPLELTGETQGDQGLLTLRLVGKYEAAFILGKQD